MLREEIQEGKFCAALRSSRALRFALCALLFALCSLRFALCALLFALCSLLSALCALLSAKMVTVKLDK